MKKYDREFKQMAVELSKHQKDIKVLAGKLEISQDLLYRWRRELSGSGGASFPGQGNPKMTEQEKEIARLKKELRETQLDSGIYVIASKNFGFSQIMTILMKRAVLLAAIANQLSTRINQIQ
ncbi:MAG: transposase [Bacteroidales bacterium]